MNAFWNSGRKSDNDSVTPRRKTPMGKIVLAAATLLVAGSAVTASPAMASTDQWGCTVTPLKPTATQVLGASWADYPIRVTCEGGRTAIVEQVRYERDGRVDDRTGSSHFRHTFWPFSGMTTMISNHTVDDGDGDGDAEILHKVRFKVEKDGRDSAWTPWESSPVRTVSFP